MVSLFTPYCTTASGVLVCTCVCGVSVLVCTFVVLCCFSFSVSLVVVSMCTLVFNCLRVGWWL